MRFNDDFSEVVVELVADIDEIGNEDVWAFFVTEDGDKIYTDYRFKNTPDEKMPSAFGAETVEEINARTLLQLMREQVRRHR